VRAFIQTLRYAVVTNAVTPIVFGVRTAVYTLCVTECSGEAFAIIHTTAQQLASNERIAVFV
jgi:hypothetical protein